MVKKKYTYTKKGKYYTYSRISRMLTQYGKFKLGVSLSLKWRNRDDGGFLFGVDGGDNDPFPQASLGSLMCLCTVYDGLRQMYSAYKVRGMAIETMPFNTPISYVDEEGHTFIPFNGMVAIGLFTEGGGANKNERLARRVDYRKISDADKGMVLDTRNRQRKYFTFNQYDFTAFPNGNVERSVPYVPLFLHCNFSEITILGNYINWPEWIIKLTFYVTVKDKVL